MATYQIIDDARIERVHEVNTGRGKLFLVQVSGRGVPTKTYFTSVEGLREGMEGVARFDYPEFRVEKESRVDAAGVERTNDVMWSCYRRIHSFTAKTQPVGQGNK